MYGIDQLSEAVVIYLLALLWRERTEVRVVLLGFSSPSPATREREFNSPHLPF
jgi:hypothetical protein